MLVSARDGVLRTLSLHGCACFGWFALWGYDGFTWLVGLVRFALDFNVFLILHGTLWDVSR